MATGDGAEALFYLGDEPAEEGFGIERGGGGASYVGLFIGGEEEGDALGDFEHTGTDGDLGGLLVRGWGHFFIPNSIIGTGFPNFSLWRRGFWGFGRGVGC